MDRTYKGQEVNAPARPGQREAPGIGQGDGLVLFH